MEHDNLTNEKLKGKFSSQFDLVNFAIHVAKDMVTSGRAARYESEMENPVFQVLEEISEGRILLNDIDEKIEVSEEIIIEPEENAVVA